MGKTENEPKRRILIIDDNTAIHEDYKKVLKGVASDSELDQLEAEMFGSSETPLNDSPEYETFSAFQGRDGYEMVKESIEANNPFDMAFVDMRMPPGWDGLETILHLWKADPDLNVVICTAFSDYDWSEVATKLGTNDKWLILKKPFDPAEVCQLAGALTEKRKLSTALNTRLSWLESEVRARTKEIEAREERLQTVLDVAPDGIVTINQRGEIESANVAAAAMFGYSQTEMQGRPVDILTSCDDSLTALKSMIEQVGLQQNRTVDCECQKSCGATFPSHWTIGKRIDGPGRFQTAIVRDESEHERMRANLAQAQKLEAVGQLAAGIAHEINTPAQFVGENTRFLKDAFDDIGTTLESLQRLVDKCDSDSLATEEKEAAKHAIDQSDIPYLVSEIPKAIDQSLDGISRISAIVRAMKGFSHPGSAEMALTNIHECLDNTITVCQTEWKYVAEIERNYDECLALVPCNAPEINQVFINLLVNAAHAVADSLEKSTETKGNIIVSTKAFSDHAEITIQDSGVGIPKANCSRIFDPFFTTKEVGKGTGQGLSIARSIIVDKHNGKIEVDSRPGEGTTFRIQLPLNRGEEVLSSQDENSAHQPLAEMVV